MWEVTTQGNSFDGNLEIKCKRYGQINQIGSVKLVDDSTHYLLIINNLGIITNSSDSAARILGYGRGELIGKSIVQINSSLPNEIGIKFFGSDSVLSADNTLRLDTTHETRDKRKIPVSVLLKLYSPYGKEQYILEYVTIKNTMSDLESDDLNTKQFVENTCDYYFDLDKNGVEEYVSPSIQKIFGFSSENIIGKNYFDLLPFSSILKEKETFAYFSLKEQSYRVIEDVGFDSSYNRVSSDLYFTTRFNEVGKFVGYRVLGWITELDNYTSFWSTYLTYLGYKP
jgi:PAS domain-containing protein